MESPSAAAAGWREVRSPSFIATTRRRGEWCSQFRSLDTRFAGRRRRRVGIGIAQQVSDTVDTRFQHASKSFSDEQELMRGQLQTGQERITATQAIIEKSLEALKTNVDTAVAKMAAVSDGKLDGVASKLVEQEDKMTGFAVAMASYEADQAKNIQVIHTVMSGEVRTMHGDVTQLGSTLNHRMGQVEHIVQQQMMNAPVDGGRQSPGGARGYQIRVPDPKSWNLTVLKNGETGFLPWRKSF